MININEVNAILLTKKLSAIVIEKNNSPHLDHLSTIISFNKNIESLGYTMDLKLIEELHYLSRTKLLAFFDHMLETLTEMRGANVKYKPMYCNFPKQLMEMSEVELYVNAIMHYLGDCVGLRILPSYVKEDREEIDPTTYPNLDIIKLSSVDTIIELANNLLTSKASLSETDRDSLKTLFPILTTHVSKPPIVQFKENLIFAIVNCDDFLYKNALTEQLKTATDILRLAVGFSGGDISLTEDTKFKSFTRPIRKLLLNRLEHIENITEDMLRFKEQWKRLGEKLHPGEYTKFVNVNKSFKILRDNLKFTTDGTTIEEGIKSKKGLDKILKVLSRKPGVFARKLDHLIRVYDKDLTLILDEFKTVSLVIPPRVLLQVKAHFRSRGTDWDTRSFMPKGNLSKIQVLENNLIPLKRNVCIAVEAICDEALKEHFGVLEPLGNVYIDPKLNQIMIPMTERSASKQLKTIPRGSVVDMSDSSTNVIRLFCWWKQAGNDRCDIDLSAAGFDSNFRFMGQIAYYDLRGDMGCHSGDITSAPNGASEFIDINIDSAISKGYRYIAMTLNSFTHQAYKDIPECFAGVMYRNKSGLNTGEIYDPRTVAQKFDISADTTMSMPLMFDIQERKMIWMDLSVKSRAMYNNVHSNESSITKIVKSIAECQYRKSTLGDLFKLHAQSRGKIVLNRDEADVVFGMDNSTVNSTLSW